MTLPAPPPTATDADPTARAVQALTRALLAHPRVLAAGVALTVASGAIGAARLRDARVDLAAMHAAHANLPPPPLVDLVVVPTAGADLRALSDALATIPGVVASTPIAPPPAGIRRVSGLDGAPVVLLSVRRDADDRALVDAVTAAAPAGSLIAGAPVFDLAHGDAARVEQRRLLLAVGGVTVALAAGLTRRLAGVLIPLAAVGTAAIATAGLVGVSGSTLAGPNLLLMPLVIVLGLSDSLYLVRDHAERKLRGDKDPATGTLAEVGHACLLTSLTTMVGFAALAATGSNVLRDFGALAAIGIGVAWCTSVAIPALAWRAFRDPSGFARPEGTNWPLVETLADRALRWRRPVGAGVVAAALALAWPASQVDAELLPGGELPDDAPARAAWRAVDAAVDGAALFTIRVDARDPDDPAVLDGLATLGEALRPMSAVGAVVGPAEIALGATEGRENLLRGGPGFARRVAWRRARAAIANEDPSFRPEGPFEVRVQLRDADAGAWSAVLDRVRQVDARTPAFKLTPTGAPVTVVAAWARLPGDAAKVIGASLLTLVGGLAVSWRSARIAAAASAPLVVTAELCLAAMSALNVPISPPTLLVFSVALGVGVDASIHLFSAARVATRRGESPEGAVREALVGAGVALFTSTALLLGGLATLLLSELAVVRDVGVTLLVAMAGNAIVSVLAFAAFGPWALTSPLADTDGPR
jgi:predicted RND superfamily exporter protein